MSNTARIFRKGVTDFLFTGGGLLISREDQIFLEYYTGKEKQDGKDITPYHFFDLASLTKPIGVATIFMVAQSQGRIDVFHNRLSHLFPKTWLSAGLKDLPLWSLLTHSSGLPAWSSLYDHYLTISSARRKDVLTKELLSTPPLYRPLSASTYSDLGYIILGFILEIIYGKSLKTIFYETTGQIFEEPLDLCYGSFPPPEEASVEKPLPATSLILPAAATSFCPKRKRLLLGEVHDENSFVLGGVTGHAGLFGTLKSVHRWLRKLFFIWSGKENGKVLRSEIIKLFWDPPEKVPGSTWVLGFDRPDSSNSTAGDFFSPHSIGHLGFTGTSFWLDIEDGFSVVALTNRVYYRDTEKKMKIFRREIHNGAKLEYA